MKKKEVLKILKSTTWNTQGFNAHPLFLLNAGNRSAWRVADTFGKGYGHLFLLFSNGRALMHYDEADLAAISDAFYAKIKDVQSVNALISKSNAVSKETFLELESMRTHVDIATADLPAMIAYACRLREQLVDACGRVSHVIEGVSFGSEHMLREILKKKGVFSEILLSKLSSPITLSFIFRARTLLWQIQNASSSKKDALIEKFLHDYRWIKNTYIGSAHLTSSSVAEDAAEILQEPAGSDFKALTEEKERIMAELSFNPTERFVVTAIEKMSAWQDERKMHILETVELFDPAMERLAELVNLDPVTLKYLDSDELGVKDLTSKEFADELTERRKGCAFYATPHGSFVFTGEAYAFLIRELHSGLDNDITELSGTVAQRGLMEGLARVCKSVHGISKVQKGEILVTSMTRPEYLSAMQKAAAFVTDEGGITCHAAIIAREMKKPCIIGTKIATRVLKDGDMIRVDADRGIVTVLQRHAH